MAKNGQKVKANPLPFWSFWPLFQLFKNGSKTKYNRFWIIFKDSYRDFRPLQAVFKKLKKWLKTAKK